MSAIPGKARKLKTDAALFLDDIGAAEAVPLSQPQIAEGFKSASVRLLASEFRTFVRAAHDNGFPNIQAAMVYAMTRAMADWGHTKPLTNPGTSKLTKPGERPRIRRQG